MRAGPTAARPAGVGWWVKQIEINGEVLSHAEVKQRVKFVQAIMPKATTEHILEVLKVNDFHVKRTIEHLVDEMTHHAGELEASKKLHAQSIAMLQQSYKMPGSTFYSKFDDGSRRPAPPADDYGTADAPLGGRKKALLVGINYFGTRRELNGCVDDIFRMRNLITKVYGFLDDPLCMTILTDKPGHNARLSPTRRNCLAAMEWLVSDAQAGDVLFFQYSGHGGQKRNLKGTEIDGFDETIMPLDYKQAGHITDDELHEVLVRSLPRGVKLICVMDCCHSGSGLDLPFYWPITDNFKAKLEYFKPIIQARAAGGPAERQPIAKVDTLPPDEDDWDPDDPFVLRPDPLEEEAPPAKITIRREKEPALTRLPAMEEPKGVMSPKSPTKSALKVAKPLLDVPNCMMSVHHIKPTVAFARSFDLRREPSVGALELNDRCRTAEMTGSDSSCEVRYRDGGDGLSSMEDEEVVLTRDAHTMTGAHVMRPLTRVAVNWPTAQQMPAYQKQAAPSYHQHEGGTHHQAAYQQHTPAYQQAPAAQFRARHVQQPVAYANMMGVQQFQQGEDEAVLCLWEKEPFPKHSEGNVLLISSCQDSETAADLLIPGWGAGGAVTLGLVTTLTNARCPHSITVYELAKSLRRFLSDRKFQQSPQLSTTLPFNPLTTKFDFSV